MNATFSRSQVREGHVRRYELMKMRFSGQVHESQLHVLDDLIREGNEALGPSGCECGICGRIMEPRFLSDWNGIDACGPCRHEQQDEYEAFAGVYDDIFGTEGANLDAGYPSFPQEACLDYGNVSGQRR